MTTPIERMIDAAVAVTPCLCCGLKQSACECEPPAVALWCGVCKKCPEHCADTSQCHRWWVRLARKLQAEELKGCL